MYIHASTVPTIASIACRILGAGLAVTLRGEGGTGGGTSAPALRDRGKKVALAVAEGGVVGRRRVACDVP